MNYGINSGSFLLLWMRAMKFIGKLLLTILLLLLLAVLLIYFVGQTRWAADWVSRWISQNSEYRLSVERITHSWNQPEQIHLTGVTFGQNNQPPVLIAKQIELGLSLQQLTVPDHFDSLTLYDGTFNISPRQEAILPVQAGVLRLRNMTLQFNDGDDWQLTAQQVNAGITPWQAKTGDILGENTQFQLSAASMALNGVPASQVLVQGEVNQGKLFFNNFGAGVAQGELTGAAWRDTDGQWQVNSLRLSHVRFQSALTLAKFQERFRTLAPITVQRLDLIDARLEGIEWAINGLNLALKEVTFQNGNWRSQQGTLSVNASDVIYGGLHLIDPIISAQLSPKGIAIDEFSTRWQNGLLRATGKWQQAEQRLQLDDLAVVGVEYTLPTDWRDLWLQPLPSWLAEVYLAKMITNRNLLIDINPDFPFQITGLDGYASDLLLAKDHHWGIWSGSLKLNAHDATFNRVDVRLPSMALRANEKQISVTELSAFRSDGLLNAKVNIEQLPRKPFTLSLDGRSVPLNTLQQWGWRPVPLEGEGNLRLELQGLLNGEQSFKSSLQGILSATDKEGQTLKQPLPEKEMNNRGGSSSE